MHTSADPLHQHNGDRSWSFVLSPKREFHSYEHIARFLRRSQYFIWSALDCLICALCAYVCRTAGTRRLAIDLLSSLLIAEVKVEPHLIYCFLFSGSLFFYCYSWYLSTCGGGCWLRREEEAMLGLGREEWKVQWRVEQRPTAAMGSCSDFSFILF